MSAAQHTTAEIECQMNMRTIWQGLQLAVNAEGSYPDSKSELIRWCGDARVFRCADPNGGDYHYVPPRGIDSDQPNIIVYEPNAVHDGHCSVLLTNGQIGMMRPHEIKAALAQTGLDQPGCVVGMVSAQ